MSGLDDLLTKQKELMAKVPHDVNAHILAKMKASIKILDLLLRYYNAVGGKPWRPRPLSPLVQQGLLKELKNAVGVLGYIHSTRAGTSLDLGGHGVLPRQYVSGFGIIEESVEYMNSLTDNSSGPHKLEELVDILFFWLEQVAMSGFTMQEVVGEYHRKHAINLKRYEDAEKGNWDWDRRNKEAL